VPSISGKLTRSNFRASAACVPAAVRSGTYPATTQTPKQQRNAGREAQRIVWCDAKQEARYPAVRRDDSGGAELDAGGD
jgi:hypothetical protein